jgi:hypothetical protein
MTRRHAVRRILLPLVAVTVIVSASPAEAVYRAFSRSSFWNTPLPRDAPRHPDSNRIIEFLKADNDTNFIRLAGATDSGEWGMPTYWAGPKAKTYDVRNNCSQGQPPEFDHVRIPRGAEADPTSDAAMTVYDRDAGRVYGLFHARYDRSADVWSSCGGTVYYLGSNGLHGDLAASNQPRNRGHRGLPPSTWAVRYGEVDARRLNHVLKISVNTTKCTHVFPMVGNECGTTAAYAPAEGTRIRIKPSVDLSRLNLSPAEMTVARALQRYGAVIGDQTGGPVVLKLENTIAAGRGFLWKGVLQPESLRPIPLGYFEVIKPGYRP